MTHSSAEGTKPEKKKKKREQSKNSKSKNVDCAEEVDQARAVAAQLQARAAAREAKQKLKLVQEEGGAKRPADTAGDDGPSKRRREDKATESEAGSIDIEARLIAACKAAKAAAKAEPASDGLAEAYKAAKAGYAAFQQAKAGQKRKDPAGSNARPFDPDSEVWTCELCGTTLSVRSDGRAREQHIAGKAHQKRVAAAEAATREAEAVAQGEMYTCKVCGDLTLAASAREAHEGGKKHRARVAALEELVVKEGDDGATSFKAGDWVCCRQAGSHSRPQHNFRANDVCVREGCGGARAIGLSFEEVTELARSAQKARAAAGKSAAVVATDANVDLACRDCGESFHFTPKEQRFYSEKRFAAPRRCPPCRGGKSGAAAGRPDAAE